MEDAKTLYVDLASVKFERVGDQMIQVKLNSVLGDKVTVSVYVDRDGALNFIET